MDKKKKALMWTILTIALIQMPGLALTPAINQIQTSAFPDKSLGLVQTVLGSSNLIAPFAAVLTAMLINRRLISKKGVVLLGLCLLTATGVLAVVMHTEFWHLYLLSAVLGVSTGCYMTNAFGLLFDNFDPDERQAISGYQTSCISIGGIIMSILGGLLATMMWYGGYLMLLLGVPVAILAYFTVPHYKSPRREPGSAPRGKLRPMVFYYSAIIFVFMMVYTVCGSNLSTHIAGIGTSATAGIATAVQMGGGAVAGLFFGRLSKKLGDFIIALACVVAFAGFLLLSLFQSSLAATFIGVFMIGTSLSAIVPRCIFRVSMLGDQTNSAMSTALASSIAPSFGGFLSPLVFTNITTWLFGESTAPRYRFVSIVILALGVAVAVVAALSRRSAETAKQN